MLHRLANNTATEGERAEFFAYLQGLSPAACRDLMDQYGVIVQRSRYEGTPDADLLARIEGRIGVLEALMGGMEQREMPAGEEKDWRDGMRAVQTMEGVGREGEVGTEGLEYGSDWREGTQEVRTMEGVGREGEVRTAEGEGRERGGRRWIYWAAAAACVLLIAGTYLINRSSRPVVGPSGPVAAVPAIQPGGSKAVLTLGNGTQIVLDSMANGMLADQGEMEVVKAGNGQLQYRMKGVGGTDRYGKGATGEEAGGATGTTGANGGDAGGTTGAGGTNGYGKGRNGGELGGRNSGAASGILYNTLATPRGGQYQLVLPDGTKVWLNAASSIKYPTVFTGNSREVEITGEAYFEVASNTARPFRVNLATGGMKVEVLGTHFNIHAYQDGAGEPVRTTLLEGAIRVSLEGKGQEPNGGSSGTKGQEPNGGSSGTKGQEPKGGSLGTKGQEPKGGSLGAKVIRPGQQASVVIGNRRFEVLDNVDLESVMAWKNGKLVFRKGNIQELMREISRWYDVDVRYQGSIPSGKFYGLIDRNIPLATVLHALDSYGIKTSLEGKTIIVQ